MSLASRLIGYWRIINAAAINKAKPKARTNIFTASSKLRAPYAWAVNPLVPIRRKPKFQYIKLKMLVPMVMAPIWVELRCPTMAISTMPSNGTVIFVMILGIANPKIFLFIQGTFVNVDNGMGGSVAHKGDDVAFVGIPFLGKCIGEHRMTLGALVSVGIDSGS